jgi:hypothetical protein
MFWGSRTILVPAYLVAVAFAVFSAPAAAQGPPASPSDNDKTALHKPFARFREVTAFEQYIVYWTTEPGWRTELQLRNNLELSELTVTPALRTADGTETALPAVTIKPGDVVSVDLYHALMRAAPRLVGSWGSLVLRYHAVVHRALYAAVMVSAVGRPIAFHLDPFGRGSAYQTGSREGIWWLPRESVTGYLILTNAGDQRVDPSLVLDDSSGKGWQQTLSLSPRETKRLSIRALLQQAGLTGSYGGIKIELSSGAGYVDSAHLLFDETGGFSAVMKMFTHDPASTLSSRSFGGVKEWTTRAPMLALSDPDPALGFPAGTTVQPKVFIRNASGKAFTAHIRFNWRSATASGKTVPLDLAFKPDETQVIDVAALQAQKLLPADAQWAAAILNAPVLPDDLLAVAASYDQTGRYGTQTPFSDQLASHWEAGKWEVDSTHNSLVTVGNGGNKPARAQLTILYNQGSGQYQIEKMLAPDEQMWLDFGKLIHDQVPDKDGHTLPPDLASGTYRIRDLSDRAAGGLYEGKVILDKTYGHAAYGCAICCGFEDVFMEFDPLSVPVSGYGDQEVEAGDSCGGGTQNITGDFPTWWTGNTAIATASGHQIKGIAAGTTPHYAQSAEMYFGPKEYYPSCPLSQQEPTAPTNVAPTITSISPAQGLVGAPIGVTITGTGFASGASVSAGSNISVSSVSVSSSTKITATFTSTNSSSAGGSQAVTVSVAGQPSNKQNFLVQIPTHFQRYNQPPEAPGGLGPVTTVTNGNVVDLSGNVLATHYCGVYENFLFDIADQQSNQIVNGTVTVTEVFSNITNPPGPTPSTVSVPLATNGVTDNQAYGFTYPTCLTNNQNQALNMTWTVQVGSTAYPITTLLYITKGNFNGTLNVTSTITTP